MILYEDAQLVVCCKPRGVLSAADSSGQESMAALLAPRTVFPVHRLDRDVPGVMVFAKTREAAAFLSAHLTAGKEYLALAEGAPCKEPEELYDLLFHDRARNKTYVVRRSARLARLPCLRRPEIRRAGRAGRHCPLCLAAARAAPGRAQPHVLPAGGAAAAGAAGPCGRLVNPMIL